MTALIAQSNVSDETVWLIIIVIVIVLIVAWLLAKSDASDDSASYSAAEAPVEESAPVAEEVPAEVPTEAAASPPTAPDDLKRIEGIGPKLSSVLQEAGITTFAALAVKSPDELQGILDTAGVARISDPATWPEQAALAAEGKHDELSSLQDALKGGRRI